MRKLTLNAEPEIIALAKRLAAERNTSVSKLFSQFIRSMAKPQGAAPSAPRTRAATGLVKMPADKTARELIEDAISERFLR